MDRAAKSELVGALGEVFKTTKVVVVAHYSGLTVAQMQNLRRQMKHVGAQRETTRGVAAVKEFTFRGPPAALVPMHDVARFDVLTLANNHTVDFGRDALLDTVKAVRAAGINDPQRATDLQARRPAIVEAGGPPCRVPGATPT